MTFDKYTKLLCHFNTAKATSVLAETGQTLTYVNQADCATPTPAKFNKALLLDGTDDYVTVPDSADWDFETGDFTVDFWVRFNSVASGCGFWGRNQDATHIYSLSWYQAGNLIYFYNIIAADWTGGLYFSVPWTPVADTWYHIALVRNGTAAANWFIFVDGVALTKTFIAGGYDTSIPDLTSVFTIGESAAAGTYAASYVNGYIDELRISKDIARWTTNFTPPTREYSKGGGAQVIII